MIIESIRNYFLSSPLIDDDKRINVDYLGVDALDYTIDSVPAEKVITKYVGGDTLNQYVFSFGSREYYGADTLQNIENSGFYERFATWIETENAAGNFPILTGNKKSVGMEILTSGYLFDASESTAKYQIQLRLIYYEN